jgi:hypothetical protein
MMTCEYCGGPMTRYLPSQRFCCRVCSDEWFAAERREAVEWFRACGMRPEDAREERINGHANGHAEGEGDVVSAEAKAVYSLAGKGSAPRAEVKIDLVSLGLAAPSKPIARRKIA